MAKLINIQAHKAALLIAMASLLGVYFYVNFYKLYFVSNQYAQIIQGEYAPTMTINLDGKSLLSFRLPSSDLYDAGGKRQVNFHHLDQKIFEQLKSRIEEVQVKLAGKTIAVQVNSKKNYILFELPQKKIFLLQQDDFNTMAEILRFYLR